MDKKRLVLFGTRHWNETKFPPQVRAALELVLDKFKPQVVLEEWSVTQMIKSGAHALCLQKQMPWRSIGTPSLPELSTNTFSHALDFPSSADVGRYGPLEVQEKREGIMTANIAREMETVDRAVVVMGLAHLHSMMAKLSKDFETVGYSYLPEVF